ncbi:MAG: efflux RND transporter periplasmic adaptor subunit [Alphaproteobacteria bacterium]
MIKRLLKIVLPLAILAGAVLGTVHLKATRPQLEPEPPRERDWTVAVTQATPADVQPQLRLFGEIVAGREVELRPLVAGRIVAVGDNVVEGGIVRAGELIVAIDPFDYQAAVDEASARIAETRATLARIEAELDAARKLIEGDREQAALARRDVARREKLRDSPAASEKSLDDARLAYSLKVQQVTDRAKTIARLSAEAEQEKAVLKRWQVALRLAERDLKQTRLTAPFDGFLIDADAAVGKRVGTSDRIARLVDAKRLEARFYLSNSEFSRLLAAGGYRGRPAQVIWQIGDRPFVFDAVIERVAGEIDSESGGVDLFATIRDACIDSDLRPGAFVEVRVAEQTYKNVVRLPESALHDGDTVYVVIDDHLVPRRVEMVARSGVYVLVRGDLVPDDRVVTTRFPEIGPGLRVKTP